MSKLKEKIIGDYSILKSKKTIKTFDIKSKAPCGFKITMWKKNSGLFLKEFFKSKDVLNIIDKNINDYGIISIGIKEYSDLDFFKYDPYIPIFGFNVVIQIAYPGFSKKFKKRDPLRKSKKIEILSVKNFIEKNYNYIIKSCI